MIISFSIDGVTPVGQGRPGVVMWKGFPRFYDPRTSAKWKKVVAQHAKIIMKGRKPFDGPISVDINFRFNAPKKFKKAERERMEKEMVLHTSKPDIDNLVKAVFDGMNGICFVDDTQVYRVSSIKLYAIRPGVDIIIEGE